MIKIPFVSSTHTKPPNQPSSGHTHKPPAYSPLCRDRFRDISETGRSDRLLYLETSDLKT